jgi:hypothetical protein
MVGQRLRKVRPRHREVTIQPPTRVPRVVHPQELRSDVATYELDLVPAAKGSQYETSPFTRGEAVMGGVLGFTLRPVQVADTQYDPPTPVVDCPNQSAACP